MEEVYKFVEDFPLRIKDAQNIGLSDTNKIKSILIYGMGGCYIAGLLLKSLFSEKISIDVSQRYCNKKDYGYSVLLSYSGNTKEIIEIAEKVNGKVLVVTSGGRLLKIAKRKKFRIIKIDNRLHQRFTIQHIVFPVINFLGGNFGNLSSLLKKNRNRIEKEAKKLSLRLKNKTPVFYSSEYFYPAAYRLQTCVEEDAKIIGHSNKIPELFHNEIEALPSRDFYPVFILDFKELKSLKKQIEFFKKQLKGFYEFGFYDFSKEERMFMLFYFADFLGYYLSKSQKKKMGVTEITDNIKKV